MNEGFTLFTGWTRQETVGRTAAQLGLWVDRSARDEAAEILRRNGVVRNFEARFRRRDGSEFPGSLFAQSFELSGRGRAGADGFE